MSFINSSLQFFTKWNDFKSRSSRMDIFASWMIFVAVGLVYGFIIGFANALSPGAADIIMVLGILFAITYLVLLIPSISVVVRRFHDVGLSGWWYLAVVALTTIISVVEQMLGSVDVISWILMIVFNIMLVAIPGNPHSNTYGEVTTN